MNKSTYLTGLRRGVPVGVGYFSVSFGFGAMTAVRGIRALDAALISLTTLAGAGQVAGLTLIVAGATIWETILTLLIINSRYALMSLALSQKLDEKFEFWKRLVVSFFNTDEIFAIVMAEKTPLTLPFMCGLATIPLIGWTGGTLFGALAGSVLPPLIRSALGIMIYGMFAAIVVPPARKERPVFLTVVIALAVSCAMHWLPLLREISSGIAIVICTVIAAGVCAFFFPVSDTEMP